MATTGEETKLFGGAGDIVGWGVAILIVAIMGLLVLHGPWHKINKGSVAAAGKLTPVRVAILNDSKTVGRYVPATATVHVGQAVIFTNRSDADHTVTQRGGGFDSGDLGTKAAWTFKPTKVGTVHYYCLFHPHMLGVLKVQP